MVGGAAGFSSRSRSTSIVHSVSRAARAPTAASEGAARAPTTPTVTGNSTTVREPCLITMRRTLPSCRISLTRRSRSSPVTLKLSQACRTSPLLEAASTHTGLFQTYERGREKFYFGGLAAGRPLVVGPSKRVLQHVGRHALSENLPVVARGSEV